MSTNVNPHQKNPRVDVRKRNLDYTKQLTIVKSRDELKKFEANYHDDLKDDEVQQLTQLINKKKFEILIPDLGTFVNLAEANIASGNADNKTKSNEESGSTAHSVNGDANLKQSTTQITAAQAAALNKGIKPGQVACGADMSKGASQSMRDSALETLHLNYKPIFKLPAHYIKFKEPVYEGYENFSFNELNYEVSEKDLKFLAAGLIDITASDFERVIDVFEKIVVIDQNQSLMHLQKRFAEKAPPDYRIRITKEQLEIIYQKYWKSEREKRKRSFLRIFWEKADIDDQDQNAAFRKRQKEKMKLRKKTKYEIESYFKMFELRTDSVNVLRILQSVYQREEIKKKRHLIDWSINEISLESNLKEKGINFQTKAPKLDVKRLEQSQVQNVLPFHINEFKDYHPMFMRSSINYLPDRPVTLQQRNMLIREQQSFQIPTPTKSQAAQQKLAALQQQQQQDLSENATQASVQSNGQAQKLKSEPIKISTGAAGLSARATRDQQKQAAQAAEQALQEASQKALDTSQNSSAGAQNQTPTFQEGQLNTAQPSGGATLGDKKTRRENKKKEKLREQLQQQREMSGQGEGGQQPGGISEPNLVPLTGLQRGSSTAAGRQYSQREQPIAEDVNCTMDQITVITMLLAKKQQFGVTLGDKYLRMDINNQKDLKEKIEQTFEKPKVIDEDSIMEDADEAANTLRNESTMDQTHFSIPKTNNFLPLNQQQQSLAKKSTEQIELEKEFEALLDRNFVVRRGRNNRILVKMIERNVFEEDNSEDSTNDNNLGSINYNNESNTNNSKKSLLKKRRKKYYQSPLDFIEREIPVHIKEQYSNLLQDRKFLSKRMKKTQTLYVQDSVKRVVSNQVVQSKSSFALEEAKGLSNDKNNFNSSLMSMYGNDQANNIFDSSYGASTAVNKSDSQPIDIAQPPQPINDSEQTINYILKMNLNELLDLAEGVGEVGEIEAYADGPHQLEEFQKQQEKNYKLFRMSRMPMIGGGGGGVSHHISSMGMSMNGAYGGGNNGGYSQQQPQLSHQSSYNAGMSAGNNNIQQNMQAQQIMPNQNNPNNSRINLPNMQQQASMQQTSYPQMNGYMNNGVGQQQQSMLQQQQMGSQNNLYNGTQNPQRYNSTNIVLPQSGSQQSQSQQQMIPQNDSNSYQVVAAK